MNVNSSPSSYQQGSFGFASGSAPADGQRWFRDALDNLADIDPPLTVDAGVPVVHTPDAAVVAPPAKPDAGAVAPLPDDCPELPCGIKDDPSRG